MNEPRLGRIKSLREHHKDVTRRRICDAARECFIELGLDRTSVEEITVRAGVSRATFYVYFTNKHDVLIEFLRETERERRMLFAHLLRLPKVSRAAVRAWIASHIAAHRAHRRNLHLFHIGLATNPAVQEAIVESRTKIIELLGRRYESFALKGRPSRALARRRVEATLMIIQLEQFCASVANEDNSMDEEAGLDVLTDRLFAFLCAAPYHEPTLSSDSHTD